MPDIENKKIIFVLFGATGDLALKKIFPALRGLFQEKAFDDDSQIIAVSRREWNDDDFRDFLKKEDSVGDADFLGRISYSKVDIETGEGYEDLKSSIESIKSSAPGSEVLVYLSLAPQNHPKALSSLKETGILAKGRGRVLIEKPFGIDKKTACELDKLISSFLDESQVCRVDHYLGKDTVQAIMNLQESTADFANLLDKSSVESIRVKLFEEKGIDGRGETYDRVGAFRDVGQNHMLEMLAAVVAEPHETDDWQSARAKALKALVPPAKTCEFSRRGQYEGYRQEKGVKDDSEIETAFEVTTRMSTGHLKDVPLILEAGKKMMKSEVLVEVLFKEVSGLPKRMIYSVQPVQEISIENRDGTTDRFEIPKTRDAYGNVILAAWRGDKKTFAGRDEIEALWSYTDRVVACWGKVPLEMYSDKKPFLLP